MVLRGGAFSCEGGRFLESGEPMYTCKACGGREGGREEGGREGGREGGERDIHTERS